MATARASVSSMEWEPLWVVVDSINVVDIAGMMIVAMIIVWLSLTEWMLNGMMGMVCVYGDHTSDVMVLVRTLCWVRELCSVCAGGANCR